MSKYSERFPREDRTHRNRLFEIEPFYRLGGRSFADLVNDVRVKRFLKRAVENDFAPQSLIDSIKNGIRR